MEFRYSGYYDKASERPFLRTDNHDIAERNARRGVFVWDTEKIAADGTAGDWMTA